MGCLPGLTQDGQKFSPSQTSEKLTRAVGYLRGIAQIVDASEFIQEPIALAKYLTMGHNIYIDRLLNKNACIVRDDNDAYELNNLRRITVNNEIERMAKELRYLDDWQ
jgi:hypothetical protein